MERERQVKKDEISIYLSLTSIGDIVRNVTFFSSQPIRPYLLLTRTIQTLPISVVNKENTHRKHKWLHVLLSYSSSIRCSSVTREECLSISFFFIILIDLIPRVGMTMSIFPSLHRLIDGTRRKRSCLLFSKWLVDHSWMYSIDAKGKWWLYCLDSIGEVNDGRSLEQPIRSVKVRGGFSAFLFECTTT